LSKEDEIEQGKWKDLSAERKEFASDLFLDKRIDAIFKIVGHCLNRAMQARIAKGEKLTDFDPTICINVMHKEPAEYVQRHFKIKLVCSVMLPASVILITDFKDHDRAIDGEIIKARRLALTTPSLRIAIDNEKSDGKNRL
jgi:hypothetical protein